MNNIYYINRLTGRKEREKVFGQRALDFLYSDKLLNRLARPALLAALCKWPLFSSFYGWWQKHPSTRRKIAPFIEEYGIDQTEFADPISSFRSFNDFFIRTLKPESRPFVEDESVAIMPADGRYLVYPNLEEHEGFLVKGEKFNLRTLLEDEELARNYRHGSLVIARLAPPDYHRFHFPCEGVPGGSLPINGWLYSVNPIAIRRDIHIFTKNKRTLCRFQTESFGQILYMEVGATNVGSIHQTYTPFKKQAKGAEKGYFSFGASTVLLLFPPNSIRFDEDLLKATLQGLEMRCLMGQSLGRRF